MFRTVSVILLAFSLLIACAPAKVNTIPDADFTTHSIPRNIAVLKGNETEETRQMADDLAADFRQAGFTVQVSTEIVPIMVMDEQSGDLMIPEAQYRKLVGEKSIQGFLVVKQFYGTEVHFIEAVSGKVRASGCWRTTHVTIAKEVINQIISGKISTNLCPVKWNFAH